MKKKPAVRVQVVTHDEAEPIDLTTWAREWVAAVLELEGVQNHGSVTPPARRIGA